MHSYVKCMVFTFLFLWNPTLQNYPYKKIVMVSERKRKDGLNNTMLKTLSVYM